MKQFTCITNEKVLNIKQVNCDDCLPFIKSSFVDLMELIFFMLMLLIYIVFERFESYSYM